MKFETDGLAQEVFPRKQTSRREVAHLPIEEKLRILVHLQERANAVRRATGLPEMLTWQLG